MTKSKRKLIINTLRELIGDKYYDDEHRGAKTNEYGMTKSQVIHLSEIIADFIEKIDELENK